MTSIAWDGITLAADGQTTDSGMIDTLSFKKVRKVNAVVRGEKTIAFGVAGDMAAFFAIEDWIKSGCIADEFPEKLECSGIIITTANAYVFSSESGGLYEAPENLSLGSGTSFCKSAMELGLNAKDAVKHACKLDVNTGGKITAIKCR